MLTAIHRKMGGPIQPCTVELADVMSANQSAVYQIGQLRRGDERHRAVLFKYMADRVGVAAVLQRGDSGHTWCSVLEDDACLVIDVGMSLVVSTMKLGEKTVT